MQTIRVKKMGQFNVPIHLDSLPEYRHWAYQVDNHNRFTDLFSTLSSYSRHQDTEQMNTDLIIRAYLIHGRTRQLLNISAVRDELEEFISFTYRCIYNMIERPIQRTLYGQVDITPLKECISLFHDISSKLGIIVESFDTYIRRIHPDHILFTSIYNVYTAFWFKQIMDKLSEIINEYYFVPYSFKEDIETYLQLNREIYEYEDVLLMFEESDKDESEKSSQSSRISSIHTSEEE